MRQQGNITHHCQVEQKILTIALKGHVPLSCTVRLISVELKYLGYLRLLGAVMQVEEFDGLITAVSKTLPTTPSVDHFCSLS